MKDFDRYADNSLLAGALSADIMLFTRITRCSLLAGLSTAAREFGSLSDALCLDVLKTFLLLMSCDSTFWVPNSWSVSPQIVRDCRRIVFVAVC